MKSERYDERALIEAYIHTLDPKIPQYPPLIEYFKSLLAALEKRFQVRISREALGQENHLYPLWTLFSATVQSFLSIRTPLSGFLEAGLIGWGISVLPGGGKTVWEKLKAINELADASQAAHMQLLQTLFHELFGEVTAVVTSEELLADGFDDSELWKIKTSDQYFDGL